MEGDLDGFDYVLAEALGMTVEEMQNRMSQAEYTRWRAFFTYRHAMQELDRTEVR